MTPRGSKFRCLLRSAVVLSLYWAVPRSSMEIQDACDCRRRHGSNKFPVSHLLFTCIAFIHCNHVTNFYAFFTTCRNPGPKDYYGRKKNWPKYVEYLSEYQEQARNEWEDRQRSLLAKHEKKKRDVVGGASSGAEKLLSLKEGRPNRAQPSRVSVLHLVVQFFIMGPNNFCSIIWRFCTFIVDLPVMCPWPWQSVAERQLTIFSVGPTGPRNVKTPRGWIVGEPALVPEPIRNEEIWSQNLLRLRI